MHKPFIVLRQQNTGLQGQHASVLSEQLAVLDQLAITV